MRKLCIMGVVVMLLAVCAQIAVAAPPATRMAPTATATLGQLASQQPDLSEFVQHVQAAGLSPSLQGTGPYTVFAPTNSAFGKIPKSTMSMLMQPRNKAMLMSILKYHVVRGNYTMADLKKMSSGSKLTTIEGKTITVTRRGNDVYLDSARIMGGEMRAKNGILYKIDTVLTPPRS